MLRSTRVLRSVEHQYIGRPLSVNRPLFYECVSDFGAKTEENYQKTLKHWNRAEIDEVIMDMLFDYANVPVKSISMEANLCQDLLVEPEYRFGFVEDLQYKFQFRIPHERWYSRDLQSGKEASAWVASIMEEFGRLKY